MTTMTSRQRVRAALDHRAPDRVPVEFGATPTTGIHVSCVHALRQHYGLEARPVKVCEPYQMLGWIETDLAEVLDLDVESVNPHKTMFGFANEGWREFRLPWGQEVLVPADFVTTADAIVFWGGGVDTQLTLPFGTPDEVREQVLERCDILGAGGGFVFNTVHNVQALTPTANIVAMFDALRQHAGRRC